METVTLHIRMWFIPPPPHGEHQKFQEDGGPRGGYFQGGGVIFSGLFFPGTLKQELLFLLMILQCTFK